MNIAIYNITFSAVETLSKHLWEINYTLIRAQALYCFVTRMHTLLRIAPPPVAASVIFPSLISFLFQTTEALWIFAACESAR